MRRVWDVLAWVLFAVVIVVTIVDVIHGDYSLLAALVVEIVALVALALYDVERGMSDRARRWAMVGVMLLGLSAYIIVEVIQR